MPKGKKAADRLPLPTASEAAFEKLLASFLHPDSTEPSAPAPPSQLRERDQFVTRIFEEREKYLKPRTIADAPYFHSKIKGISFEGRQDVIPGLKAGAPLTLERQPDNPHDHNAIAILFGNLQLGFISREHAVHLAPAMDAGAVYRCRIADVTGGGERFFGINIWVERSGAARSSASSSQAIDADERNVHEALIGQHPVRKAQQDILDRVAAGKNTLAVLGTGRGKSFCFQYPAAVRALESRQKTVAIYPLRALANDQFEALRRRLDGFGLAMFRANGSIDAEERTALFAALESGDWDLVFATPEFLQFHRDAFSELSRPSFVVVDEAHHLHESRHREAYGRLGAVIRGLGAPQVLALTATARDEAFAEVTRELAIDAWVIDPTVRDNLHIVDARNRGNKIGYLRDLFEDSGRAIVYCNSKRETVTVADELRKTYGNDVV
ncbi:MAG: DEAD/DEAH box helicase, partial [Candidatus Eremiobacteraeota bacterium]|nr:DEAD/DEAH box helicase [Candidatus Eremiobacteraeota bacterium]